jgi:ferrous iron transport protein B
MGIEKENWPATVGIFTGILAKEVVVGTLNSIYTQISLEGIEQQEQTYDLFQSLSDAVATIPQNLSGLTDFLFDPLGLDVGDLNNSDSMAEDLEVTKGIFGVMSERFDGQAGAFSYLLFILLYFPCVATIGAIAKEAGRAWAIFVAFWSTSVAYITAVLFYQFSRFSVDPFYASVTIALIIIYTLLLFMGLRSYANKQQTAVVQTS